MVAWSLTFKSSYFCSLVTRLVGLILIKGWSIYFRHIYICNAIIRQTILLIVDSSSTMKAIIITFAVRHINTFIWIWVCSYVKCPRDILKTLSLLHCTVIFLVRMYKNSIGLFILRLHSLLKLIGRTTCGGFKKGLLFQIFYFICSRGRC